MYTHTHIHDLGYLPVDQIEIKVIQLQQLQRRFKSRLDIFGTMAGVPQFGGDKEFFTRHATVLDGLTHFLFVTVYTKRVSCHFLLQSGI